MTKKYGMIKNGVVESVFHSDKDKSAYPDIMVLLVEIPENVDCNWLYDGVKFTSPPTPEE